MIAETAEMLFVTTASETEALLLESNLIKRLKPRYNVSFRDDKSFPNILLRAGPSFPQLLKHRGAKTAKGVYFGPFASAGAVNRTLNTLQRAFLLRSCSDSVFEAARGPACSIRSSAAARPASGASTRPAIANWCDEAEEFLTGKSRAVQDELARDMNAASEALDFERAARLRDRIARDEPYPVAAGHQSHELRRGRCVRRIQRGRAHLHPGVLLPRRAELGQPALFPAPRPRAPAAEVLEILHRPVL